MPEFSHAKPAASPVVHQDNVKFAPFSRSGEVRGILRQRLAQCTSSQQAQEYAHVFRSGNHLFDADARNVQSGHGGANISISFVGANQERSCFGDREVRARHTGSRDEKSRPSVISHSFGQEVRIIIIRIRTNSSCEESSHILTSFMNGGSYDVARRLTVELLDSFT